MMLNINIPYIIQDFMDMKPIFFFFFFGGGGERREQPPIKGSAMPG